MAVIATRKILALAKSLTKGDGFLGCLACSSMKRGYWRLMVVTVVVEMIDGSLACEVERWRWEVEQLSRGNKARLLST